MKVTTLHFENERIKLNAIGKEMVSHFKNSSHCQWKRKRENEMTQLHLIEGTWGTIRIDFALNQTEVPLIRIVSTFSA